MSVPNSARSRTAAPLLVLLVAVLVTGGGWTWVVLETPAEVRMLVGVAGGVLALLLSVAAALLAQRAARLRREREQISALNDELGHLVDDLLPAAVQRLRSGASADTVLAQLPKPRNEAHQRLLRTLTREISVGERRRAAAMAACGNAAGRVQALATSMLADLRDMEHRYSEDALGDLLKIDHSTAQAGRLADSIAVLTGARTGRRWTKPIVMESVLRGAMGRIGAYQRVHVHSTCTSAVVGYAAEDVMHALAELMDNATKFSAPSEEVHVYVEELHNGVVITIEDGGLGMKPQALERAKAAIASTEPLDLAQLSGTRLGLAVVGTLARKHQLQVFFRPSSRGGTGVVLRLPNQLITQPRQRPAEAAPAPRPALEVPAARPANHVESAVAVEEPKALPKRPRGQTLNATRSSGSPSGPSSNRPRMDSGARFGAFRQARARNSEGGKPSDDSE
ncbi:signal transduction histidine kinase [Amycolatopsis bartoniae]|uniref:histidine kinase n=1 Tax=Amycolatopsis bartoniae TaxID=941986 RepID=A0A8H9MDI2_9PSEU|nr:ATP-binding protein [Amycolatopsis bartoniae]MBB2938706.1 signal transduction histidine kinase [Amycolatopsis bartoniae]TVT11509.1 ATP-binding protein [Amycolatopsis bartoniae]GHF79572.1 histidine kinase [Amycolatopsis bartoniae]